MPSVKSANTSGTVTPTLSAAPPSQSIKPSSESLEARERAVLQCDAAFNSLRPPPSSKPLAVKKVVESAPATSANLSRRPKSQVVRFSPAKAVKRSARGLQANPSNSRVEGSSLSQDFCDACGGQGHLLVCDGARCSRSFHFSCLDPPLELDQLPPDAWYCKACEVAKKPRKAPKGGLFGPLFDRLEIDTPKSFRLPASVLNSFESVSTSASGDFINQADFKAPRLNKGGFVEPPDPFKLKDRNGRWAHCFACHRAACAAEQKRVISCDYCELHWHLDCLDPPLATLPPAARKWMCPAHVEHLLPKMRKMKPQHTAKAAQRGAGNNGNISVQARPEPPRHQPRWKEQTHRGIRYQVPEDTLILDFWARVRNPDERLLNQRRLARQLGEHADGNVSDSSDLTSLDSDNEDAQLHQPVASTSAPDMSQQAAGPIAQPLNLAAAVAARTVNPHESPLPLDQRYSSASPDLEAASFYGEPSSELGMMTEDERSEIGSRAPAPALSIVEPPTASTSLAASASSAAPAQSRRPSTEPESWNGQASLSLDSGGKRKRDGLSPQDGRSKRQRDSAKGSGSPMPLSESATTHVATPVDTPAATPPAEQPSTQPPSAVSEHHYSPQVNRKASGSPAPEAVDASTSSAAAAPPKLPSFKIKVPRRPDAPAADSASDSNSADKQTPIVADSRPESGLATAELNGNAPAATQLDSNGTYASAAAASTTTSAVQTTALSPEAPQHQSVGLSGIHFVDEKPTTRLLLLRDSGYAAQHGNLKSFLFGDTPMVPELHSARSNNSWGLPWEAGRTSQ